MDNYAWSKDGENFDYWSLNDLLRDYPELSAGTTVRFGTVEHPEASFISADEVIDTISNAAWDEYGERADDFPDVSAEGMKELEDFLSAWQEKHCSPTFWLVRNVKEHVVTDQEYNSAHESTLAATKEPPTC